MGNVSTGGVSTEEDDAWTGSNEEISLGTLATGNVLKEEDDASVDGTFTSDATFKEEESPSTPWWSLCGIEHPLGSGTSSLVERAASFVKPLSTVGPTLNKKPRSALATAGRRLQGCQDKHEAAACLEEEK